LSSWRQSGSAPLRPEAADPEWPLHFVFSTDTDSGAGEASSDEMEYCWTASSQRFVGAGCATFKRSARQ
jgi:hypothetical protein